jgi:hypothetical protein
MRHSHARTMVQLIAAAEKSASAKLLPNPVLNEVPGHGICKERNCESKAEIDYNGHGYWVCRKHYDSLSDYFDKEYS